MMTALPQAQATLILRVMMVESLWLVFLLIPQQCLLMCLANKWVGNLLANRDSINLRPLRYNYIMQSQPSLKYHSVVVSSHQISPNHSKWWWTEEHVGTNPMHHALVTSNYLIWSSKNSKVSEDSIYFQLYLILPA